MYFIPEKLAIPATAFTVRVPDNPVPEIVTAEVESGPVVTMFPFASRTVTIGCEVNETSLVCAPETVAPFD